MNMEMPQVTEHHRKLSFLSGKWTAEETMYPSPWDPQGGKAAGRIESTVGMDGFFVVSDYVQERGGQVSYRGHGVYGYDATENCYTMHWFDSIGCVPPSPARGRFSGDSLTFEQRNPMGHSRYIYTLRGDGKYYFKIENSQDGKQWVTFMDAEYRRV